MLTSSCSYSTCTNTIYIRPGANKRSHQWKPVCVFCIRESTSAHEIVMGFKPLIEVSANANTLHYKIYAMGY